MLSGDFFDIQSFTSENGDEGQQKIHVVVSIIGSHPIFQGHFPGSPVVPGVCQVQMVKELIEKAVRHRLNLTESDNIKFLSMINPQVNPQLEFNILIKPVTVQQLSATATIESGPSLFLKFKGKFESEGSCQKN
jgi:3-hydroxyacyl-[acyl-carrier-protein] dehydratase